MILQGKLTMKKLALASVATAVLGGGAAFLFIDRDGNAAQPAAAPQGPPPATVSVESVVEQTVPATTLVPGTVVSRNDARIAAEVNGRLAWVAEVGTEIAAGGVVARIDDTEPKLQLAQAEASLARSQAALTLATQQWERAQSLAGQKLVSQGELDESRSRFVMAEQDLNQARVARDQAQYRVDRSSVRAPFGGRVADRMRQPGEFIGVGGELVRLVDTRNVEVRAQAPLAVAQYVATGRPVTVTDGAESRQERIRAVVPVGDERSRMIEVRVASSARWPAHWTVGAPVRVALPQSAPRGALAVHRDALVLREDGLYVFKVDAESKAARVKVTTGNEQGDLVEVVGELAVGDRVITRGAERLQPGQAVSVSQG